MKPNMQEAKLRTKEEVETIYFDNNFEKIGEGKTFHIKTYGCQMNEHDSELIRNMMLQMGYLEIEEMEEADVIILNTCAIRENAHNKTFGMIGRIKHLKESKPEVITCICGCMPQEEVVAIRLEKDYKWIDVIFGTHNIHEFSNLLLKSIKEKKQQLNVTSIEGQIIENLEFKRDSKYKAFVNIIYGCDKFCTYCIVPYTRGKERSRSMEDIIKEVEGLKEAGYKEVTLLGQNVNAYGKDLDDKEVTMPNLLQKVADTGIERIRFVTSHPWDFTDELIAVIKENKNVMNYVHLPVQSGSNRILKLMGRRYTKESYLELFHKLKDIPNVSITTDIIVGFPNESEEDFNETLEVVKECKYDSAFTFIYSPRVGTPAAKMEDNVDLIVKKKRLSELNKLVNQFSKEANEKYLGKTVNVLLDNTNPKYKGVISGYTETMKLVNINCDESNIGKIVKVKITEAKSFSLGGDLIE